MRRYTLIISILLAALSAIDMSAEEKKIIKGFSA